MSSSKKKNHPSLRCRLLSIQGSNSRQQIPNYGYMPSINDNTPKIGSGLRVRSIATTDKNGEIKRNYYNKDGKIIDGLAESKFLDDVDLTSDVSPNPTEIKSQSGDVHIQNSGVIKARNNLTPVQDNKLTPEGDFVNPSQLTAKGQSVIDKTKDCRAAPYIAKSV